MNDLAHIRNGAFIHVLHNNHFLCDLASRDASGILAKLKMIPNYLMGVPKVTLTANDYHELITPLSKGCLAGYCKYYKCLLRECHSHCRFSWHIPNRACLECSKNQCDDDFEVSVGYRFPRFLSELPTFFLGSRDSVLSYDEIITRSIDMPYTRHSFESRDLLFFPTSPPEEIAQEDPSPALTYLTTKLSLLFSFVSKDLLHPVLLATGVVMAVFMCYFFRLSMLMHLKKARHTRRKKSRKNRKKGRQRPVSADPSKKIANRKTNSAPPRVR